jgi:hypothetical protein
MFIRATNLFFFFFFFLKKNIPQVEIETAFKYFTDRKWFFDIFKAVSLTNKIAKQHGQQNKEIK